MLYIVLPLGLPTRWVGFSFGEIGIFLSQSTPIGVGSGFLLLPSPILSMPHSVLGLSRGDRGPVLPASTFLVSSIRLGETRVVCRFNFVLASPWGIGTGLRSRVSTSVNVLG